MNKTSKNEPVSAQSRHTNKAPDDWLYKFEVNVTSSQAALYANGNQQVQLTVTVEAQVNQTVSPTQLNSISLYTKSSDGTYLRLPINIVSEGEWGQQTERNALFDYYDNAAAGSQDAEQAPSPEESSGRAPSFKELYVVSMAPGGSKVTLIAGIDYDASTTYYSDQNPFSSTQELTAHTSRLFDDPDQFSFRRVGEPSYDQLTLDRWTLTYRLRPVDATIGFATASLRPDGMIKWARPEPGNTFATIVGWVQINNKTIQYEEKITSKFPPDVQALLTKTVPNASPTDLIIFMQGDNRFPYDYHSSANYKGPLQVRGFDKQGHPIQLAIAFEQGSRESLIVQMMKK